MIIRAGRSKRRATRTESARDRRDRKRGNVRRAQVVARSRTPRELEAARERRATRRRPARRQRRREWQVAVSGAMALSRVAMPEVLLSWRLVSLIIVLLFGSLLLRAMTSSEYFIESINLAGARYIPGDEIYQASRVHAMNIFWLDPAQVEANVAAIPGIKHAEVVIEWPATIYVEVEEREPVLVWSQGGETLWVDAEGTVFPERAALPALLPILVDDTGQPWPQAAHVPVEVIEGARQLKALRPNIELLHYDSRRGLSYQDGRGWRGYFGVGDDMEVKLAVYETLIDDLMARNVYPALVDITNADAPYYQR